LQVADEDFDEAAEALFAVEGQAEAAGDFEQYKIFLYTPFPYYIPSYIEQKLGNFSMKWGATY
jgi:hypothetical protein